MKKIKDKKLTAKDINVLLLRCSGNQIKIEKDKIFIIHGYYVYNPKTKKVIQKHRKFKLQDGGNQGRETK